MFSLKSLVVLVLALAIVCQGEKFSYKNYRLVRLTPKTQAHIHLLDLWEDNPDVRLASIYISPLYYILKLF